MSLFLKRQCEYATQTYAKVAEDVASCTYAGCVPADADAYCVIDWETYTPVIHDHGQPGGCPGAYSPGRHWSAQSVIDCHYLGSYTLGS
jgi:hypothetical protein